jgi:hypothetical protein
MTEAVKAQVITGTAPSDDEPREPASDAVLVSLRPGLEALGYHQEAATRGGRPLLDLCFAWLGPPEAPYAGLSWLRPGAPQRQVAADLADVSAGQLSSRSRVWSRW